MNHPSVDLDNLDPHPFLLASSHVFWFRVQTESPILVLERPTDLPLKSLLLRCEIRGALPLMGI